MPVAADGKKVYRNPYALPMAFTVGAHSMDEQAAKSAVSDNPFEYTNTLYSQLLGRDVKIYEPVKYRAREEGDGSYEYRLRGINKSWPVYGNIIFDGVPDIQIDVNGQYTQGYAKWMAPSVFYIPTTKSNAKLELTSASPIKPRRAQFYMVNLDEMRQVADEISGHSVRFTDHGNGQLTVDATAGAIGDELLLSVPYDSGWRVTNNGKSVRVEMFAGSLMKVPLKRGRNHIEFSYQVPGLRAGVAISVIGVVLLVGANIFERKRGHGSAEPIGGDAA